MPAELPGAAAEPAWRPALAQALTTGASAPESRYLQLATLGLDGRPCNRTVVFRGFGPDSALLVLTDRRSRKCAELARAPQAELAWYFALSREQFRLAVTVQMHGAGTRGDWQLLRQRLWDQRGAQGQAEWLGLLPDRPLAEPVDDFVLLACRVARVDHLELLPSPHRKTRYWSAGGHWQVGTGPD